MAEKEIVMPDEQRVAEVLERVDEAEKKVLGSPEQELTLSNGARVRVTPIPSMILQLLASQHPEPTVPIVEATVGGKIQKVPNPDAPAYRRALEQHQLEMGDATFKLMLLKGVEILEYPPDVPKYEEDTTWVEELNFLGIAVPEEPLARKILWLRYQVLGRSQDFKAVQDTCWELGGIFEKEIAAAEARFPADGTGATGEDLASSGD